MARERQVFPRDTVAHLWAHGGQDSARDKAGSFYFSGPSLFSYGAHFVIAYRYQCADGGHAFIVNADTYSNTTSKHQWIARRAMPRYAPTFYASDLRSDTFYSVTWRARLLRALLRDAGERYGCAADTKRMSRKRDSMTHDAEQRIRTADFLARDILARKDASADDKTAAREVLRTLAKLPPYDGTENKTQQAQAMARASILARPAMLEEFNSLLRRARGHLEDAQAFGGSARVKQRNALEAGQLFERARNMATGYKFRKPALPDTAAIVQSLEPAARLENLEEAKQDARQALRRAERDARSNHLHRKAGHYSRYNRGLSHYVQQVQDAARIADGYKAPDFVPQWMRDRAQALLARDVRAQNVAGAADDAAELGALLKSADSSADAQPATAANIYRRIVRMHDSAAHNLSATHPARSQLLSAEDRARIAAWLADVDARIAAQNAEAVARWRANLDASPRFESSGPLLRLSADKTQIETSRRAFVPVSVAPMIWQAANACRASNTPHIFTDPPRIGHFPLNRINADGSIVAGCHDIAFSELEFIAAELGYSAPHNLESLQP